MANIYCEKVKYREKQDEVQIVCYHLWKIIYTFTSIYVFAHIYVLTHTPQSIVGFTGI